MSHFFGFGTEATMFRDHDSWLSRAARSAAAFFAFKSPRTAGSAAKSAAMLVEPLEERRLFTVGYWVGLQSPGAPNTGPNYDMQIKAMYDADGNGWTDGPIDAPTPEAAVLQAAEGF